MHFLTFLKTLKRGKNKMSPPMKNISDKMFLEKTIMNGRTKNTRLNCSREILMSTSPLFLPTARKCGISLSLSTEMKSTTRMTLTVAHGITKHIVNGLKVKWTTLNQPFAKWAKASKFSAFKTLSIT